MAKVQVKAKAKGEKRGAKAARPDPIEVFARRLGSGKKLMTSFAVDPWVTAAKNGVPKAYVDALRQYEEKLLSQSVQGLNTTLKTKGVRSMVAMAAAPVEVPADLRAFANSRGWEAKFVKVERTILRKKVLLGYKLVLNDRLASDIVNGIAVVDALGAFLGAAAGAAGIAIAAVPGLKEGMLVIGAALLLQAALIQFMNKGNGVYYFASYWIFLCLIASGPAGLINAWVGPLPN